MDGTVEIKIGSDLHTVKAGEGLLLPASVPHALSAVTPFKMLLIMIKSE